MNPTRLFAASALAAVLAAPALPAFAAGDHAALEAQQQKILERLDAQDKVLKQILKKVEAGGGPRKAAKPPAVVTIDVGGSPILGKKDAPVTLVEYSDFQCPYCARAVPDVEKLKAAYPDELRVVYKHMPLERIHPQAKPAAKASWAAQQQGKFWEMHDALFANMRELGDAKFVELAKSLDLDIDRFNKDRASDAAEKQIKEDIASAMAAGVRGTPTLFINGRRVTSRSQSAMKAMVDAELKKAAK